MGKLIIISFITLDGVVEDPDCSDGTTFGGWAMRHGPGAVAGDKFRLGPVLDTATLLFGRHTWEHFSRLWPRRDDPFSTQMNRASKAVVTSRPLDLAAWSNSTIVSEPVENWLAYVQRATDVVVIGSTRLVERLMTAELVDEYRLLTFPTAIGQGRRLFTKPTSLQLVSSQAGEHTVLTILRPEGASA